MVERGDHSRVFAERGGRGYVQHPYMYHGREFGHRTYYDHGRAYDRYYNRYEYRGAFLDVYAPVRYYPVGFYGWAYNPWAVPVVYGGWGWAGSPCSRGCIADGEVAHAVNAIIQDNANARASQPMRTLMRG